MATFRRFAMFLFVFVSISSPSLVLANSPCPNERCFCHAEANIFCTELFLDRVPAFSSGFENITYTMLDLSENKIERFRPDAFQNISVKKIKMWINSKRLNLTFHSRTFRGLNHSLEVIDFRKNVISKLPIGLFRNLNKLRIVELADNRMDSLQKGVFRGAGTVEKLNLEQNLLKVLDENVFVGLSGLKHLNLVRNRISLVDSKAFNGLRKLESLDLRNNKIRDLQPYAFNQLHNLRQLYLSNNDIPALFPLMLKGLTQLEELHLTNNPIILIARQTFSNMHSLTTLHLEKCKLTYLKPGVFDGLDNLTTLVLHNNFIRSFPDRLFFGMKSLKKILLEFNELATLNVCAFEDVEDMSWAGEIWLTGNPIHCDCAMAWTSLPSVVLRVYGKCSSPEVTKDQKITSEAKYHVCRYNGFEDCHHLKQTNEVARFKYMHRYRMK